MIWLKMGKPYKHSTYCPLWLSYPGGIAKAAYKTKQGDSIPSAPIIPKGALIQK